jgi:hypothetical protein
MAAQNVKDMPLRRVMSVFSGPCGWRWERLECGHEDRARVSGLGYSTTAKRRRCRLCLCCEECGGAIYEHERMARNEDGFWHADCANAPIGG